MSGAEVSILGRLPFQRQLDPEGFAVLSLAAILVLLVVVQGRISVLAWVVKGFKMGIRISW